MITDDQVVELFAEANPIPPAAIEAASSVDGSPQDSTSEGSIMVTVQTEEREHTKRRTPLVKAALGAALAAVIAVPALLIGGDGADVATPLSPGEEAVQVVGDFYAALTFGDVDAATALMAPEMRELEFNRAAVEFFAALPGTKALSDCTASEGVSAASVRCTTHYNGPLMLATGETSTGTFRVENGLLTSFTPGGRTAAAEAFSEYASQTLPREYEQACDPDSYEVASVRTQSSGFAFAGPCGELWARVAEDAAAWVERGKPPLPSDG